MSACDIVPPAAGMRQGYAGTMRAMHWITVALLIGGYTAVWAIGKTTPDAEAAWLAMLHHSFGVTILVLTGLRIAWRQRTSVPPLPADVPAVQRLAARASVMVLYVLLIVQPLLGLIGSMLHDDPITVFGGVVVPSFLSVNKPLADWVYQVHGWNALLLLALIGVHVAAALYHHFVRRDEVLSGMLPWMRRLPQPARPGPAKDAAAGANPP